MEWLLYMQHDLFLYIKWCKSFSSFKQIDRIGVCSHQCLNIFPLRACLQSVGWSWGRQKELNIYWRSASTTSKAHFRSACYSHSSGIRMIFTEQSKSIITSPNRCGVNHQMVLVQSTFSQVWEDSCRLCCLVTQASGQLSILPPPIIWTQNIRSKTPHLWQFSFFCFSFVVEFKKNAWPFPQFFLPTYLSSASVAWTT